MLEVYGQLIRAQLQISATDLSPTATGLIYFNTTTGVKWHNGTAWKIAADLDSSQTLSNKTFSVVDINPGILNIYDTDSNGTKVTISSPVFITDYTLTLPSSQSGQNQFLKNDGLGQLIWSEVPSKIINNYLDIWFDCTRSIGTIVTNLTSTGNRTSAQNQWGSSANPFYDLTIESGSMFIHSSSYKIRSTSNITNSFLESPMFTIDNIDIGKQITVSFDVTGVSSTSNFDIVVVRYNNIGVYQQTLSVDGIASTGTPTSAVIPTGSTTFRGFFTSSSTSTDFYSLRIRKLASVSNDFHIDNIFVGSQSLGIILSSRNIIGDKSGTAVPANYCGEVISQSVVKSSQTGFTTGVARNITANPLQLGAGTWEISANIYAESGAADTMTQWFVGISTTSATLPTLDTSGVPDSNGQIRYAWNGSILNNGISGAISPYRLIVTSSTTLYLVGQISHSGGAALICGQIKAVRI